MIMASNTARTTDEIEQSNLARRKDELWFAFWLRDLKESIEKKRESYNIDARKLEKALTDIDTIKANHGLNMMSSKDSDWLPLWVIDTVAWAKGYEGYCNACGKRWLGVDLVLAGRSDLLRVLARTGDAKAVDRKVRNRMPKGLARKSLEWIKVSDREYKVLVKDGIDMQSEYDKIAKEVGES